MPSNETNHNDVKSEHKTRKELIDPEIKKRGWLKKYIKEELNSVKSDFIKKDYLLYDGKPQKGDRYVDYVLLDEDNSVLAIIESKRFSEDEEKGRVQARTYVNDIEIQINRKIPIFLTNGKVWRLIDEDGVERKISGPFSQDDLKRRNDNFMKYRDPQNVKIDSRIIDRPRSIQIVRELSEHFSKGHRKALVHMATGTGKTRVAMAITKILINANMVRNVLFIADRTALVNQAKSNGFKQFFTEPVADLRKEFSTSARLYVSTVQTLNSPKENPLHRRFSPGFFDLIIFDEAHRSYYDKNNLVEKYFDAIKIGLTATPCEQESKNTYDLFDCLNELPTVEYSYDDAVREGILVPYKAEIVDTQVLTEDTKGSELTKDLKLQLIRQEVNPEAVEFHGSQFDRIFMDDKTNEIIIREFMNQCYKSDEGKPCKSIFFCASQRHAKHMKRIFGRLFPKLSNDVQVITSEMARAEDEVLRFQLQSEPRIALSVGMLDTGIDAPEVCNLLFVKPVFSGIRFWQMVGRGTRNQNSCKHPEWLPSGEKNDFYIFDFKIGDHSNIEFHKFKVIDDKASPKGVITKIFENRVQLLKKPLDTNQKKIITDKIMYDVNSLDKQSFLVREKTDVLYKVKENSFNLERYIKDLMEEVSPLMILKPGSNPYVSMFILKTEKLFRFVLERNNEQIEIIKEYVEKMIRNILRKDNLYEIKDNKDKLTQVLQEIFWDDLTFEDVEFMIKDIAPLMRFYEPPKGKIIQMDKPDEIIHREFSIIKIKEDTKLKELLETNPLIKKIKDGEGITSIELLELEEQLSKLRPEITIENIQKIRNKDFVVFLREIIGITHEYDPKVLIERRFDEYIIESNVYNSRQLEFLNLLKKVFAERKHIQIPDLGIQPLADEHPLDYFNYDELENIVDLCNEIKIY